MQVESKSRATRIVYGALGVTWLLVAGWLALERAQVSGLARQAILNRARDISSTIALVSRAGPPGVIRQSRLEDVLNELVASTELDSVALLNAEGEVVATAGNPPSLDVEHLPAQGTRWNRGNVTVVNLVDFGQSTSDDGSVRPPTMVIPQAEEEERRRLFRERFDRATSWTRTRSGDESSEYPSFPPPPPPWEEDGSTTPMFRRFEGERGELARGLRPGDEPSTGSEARSGRSRRVFRRPFWMDPEHYEDLLAKRGLHGFVLVVSTERMNAELARDLYLRLGVAIAALLAVVGLAAGWRGVVRSTQLRIRLVRAQEMNEHLREMNLAAAGLAHEARNPLNIVRGVAQMIDQNRQIPETVQKQAGRITEEVDRVTQRLNEFIKYSRPMQPRMAATPLASVVADVLGALQTDLEDKNVQTEIRIPDQAIQADEAMLRQVIFNLVINAIQAAPEKGRIAVAFTDQPHGEGTLSVEDDGPGVPQEQRAEIFRPYFTTNAQGSGLGLAVVKQIVLAHHWEIECGTSELGGAAFRIRGMRILSTEEKIQA